MNFTGGAVYLARPQALLLLLLLLPLAAYLSRTSMTLLRRNRRRLSLGLRFAIIILLVLALSGASIVRASDRLSVVFLVDRSDSVSVDQQAREEQYVRAAIAGMGQDDSAGVVVFGANALVDRPVLSDKSPPDLASAPTTTFSNLAEAIRLSMAIAPSNTAQRMVLLSDGKENVDSAEWAARLAAARGETIDVVPLAGQSGPEVWIDSLKAPSPVSENERIALQIGISSSADTTATLLLSVDGNPLDPQQITLTRGSNTFVQNLPPAVKGFHTYLAQVVPPAGSDTRRENNSYSAFSIVQGKPRLLIVEGQPGVAAPLKAALDPSINADVVAAQAMPADLKSLAGYDGVVLVNVPASSLPAKSLDSLQLAVRDLGKGLVVVGGDESYAAGGYFRTPLEDMLPVDLNLPSKLQIPSVGMALVIDRSGSMQEAHNSDGSGVSKIAFAKEAAYRAVAQLSANDYVGVITFDSAASWVIKLQQLGDPSRFKERIGSITAGGGTNIYSGLAPAVDALIASNAKSKHILLMTDGQSEGGDYQGLVKKMQANNITLSTVAIGADADTALLKSLADAGKGRYYYTEDGNALPQIFVHESHLAARSYIIERPFTPQRVSPSPVLDGLGGLPALQGYVGTSPKPNGQIVLVSDAGDPVLAQWQYGLGRVVAWTSDAKGQWAKDWVAWQDFPRFWAQAVRWSTGAEAGNALQSQIALEGGVARVTVDAGAPDGSYLNNLSVNGLIVAPSLLTSTVQLRQSAAGRYEGRFPLTEQGAYLLNIQAAGQGMGNMSQTLGVIAPYSPEYRGDQSDNGLLSRIASLTGGRVLTLDRPGAPFEHDLRAASVSADLWPLLLLIAILLLPLDVGVRRVAVSRADLERALQDLRRKMGWQPRPVATQANSAQLTALLGVKGHVRAQSRARPELQQEDQHQSMPSTWARDLQTTEQQTRRPAVMPAPPNQQPDNTDGKGAQNEQESLAARLRKAREQRQ